METGLNILRALWRRRNLIAGVMILSVMFGLSTMAFRKPKYEATAYLYPYHNNPALGAAVDALDIASILQTVMVDLKLMDTPEYNKSLPDKKSVVGSYIQRLIAFELAEDGDPSSRSYGFDHLRESVNITQDPGARFISIYVTADAAGRAADIANAVQAQIMRNLTGSFTFVFLLDQKADARTVRFDKAYKSFIQVRPNIRPVLAIWSVIGFVFGAGAALWADRRYYQGKSLFYVTAT